MKLKTSMEELSHLIVLFFIAIASFFSTLNLGDADLMESRNFISAREMVQSGNYLLPTLNGNYRFEKPPLPTWIAAIVMKLTSITTSEFVLRLPVGLLSLLMVFLMYKLVKILTKEILPSFLSAFVLSTTLMLIKVGGTNSWDIYSYVFAFGSAVYFLEGMEKDRKISFLYMSFYLGCSIMSKGPVAIYGLFVPCVLSFGLIYGWQNIMKNWKNLTIAVLFGVLLGVSWYLYMYLGHRELFLSVMEKEVDTWSNSYPEGYFYYMDYVAFTGPWVIFSVVIWIFFWAKNRVKLSEIKLYNFGLLWTALTLLLLSLVTMKKMRYGIPIYICSAIPVGAMLTHYVSTVWSRFEKSDRMLIIVQSYILMLGSLGLPIYLLIFGVLKDRYSIPMFAIISSISLGIFLYIFKFHYKRNFIGYNFQRTTIFLSGIVFIFIYSIVAPFSENVVRNKQKGGVPLLGELRKNPPSLDIYTLTVEDFRIEDVWNVGKKIKIGLGKELPKEFLLLTHVDDSVSKMVEGYKPIEATNYYEFVNDGNLVKIFKMKKKK